MNEREVRNKKGLSPLVATIILVVFALVIGTAVMTWGDRFVRQSEIPDETAEIPPSSYIMISYADIGNNALKRLQIEYITDQIDLDEYLSEEQDRISQVRNS